MSKSEPEWEAGLGRFTVSSERNRYSVQCDRAAVAKDGTVYLLSIVAESQKCKGIGAALNSNAAVSFSGEDFRYQVGGNPVYVPCEKSLSRCAGGYRRHTHRLGYGWMQAMYVARSPGFLPSVSEEALWQELNTNRFTTPILREWLPYLTEKLLDRELLSYLPGHRCECGLLTASTADLDLIVTDGIQKRMLGKAFHQKSTESSRRSAS